MEPRKTQLRDEVSELNRREFIRYAGAAAAILGGGAAVPAAWGSSSSSAAPSVSAAQPKKGGTLRVGVTGGGPSDTLDGQLGILPPDNPRVLALFEPLVTWDRKMNLSMVLAKSMEPDAKAKTWTVRLRPGIKFHNGKPLTADDVIFSLNRIIKSKSYAYFALQLIDAPRMKKVDALTVQIPMKQAYPSFPQYYASLYQNLLIVPVGYKPAEHNGTGPFKYQSFTPGQASTFVRNPNYWRSGRPHVDKLVITDYPDENSQVNALLSKQVDCVNQISVPSIARIEQAGGRVVTAKTGVYTPIEMRVDQAPFNDERVRQALRLVVDRPKMLDVVFSGRGTIANDLFSPFDPGFDHSIPQRTQDIEKAKSLLKAAGREGLSLELVTSDIFSGVLSMAQVYADQAKAAGVKVRLKQVPTSVIFGPNYGKWKFATQNYWLTTPYLAEVAQQMLPTSPFNGSHWNNPKYSALYKQAFAARDDSRRSELIHAMQKIEHDSGGIIIPYFVPVIDGMAGNVQGVEPGRLGFSFGNWSLEDIWLA